MQKLLIEHARQHKKNVVIIDTAGRQQVDEAMMQELKDIKAAVEIDQTILVVDATTGQNAVNVSDTFNQEVGIDGVDPDKTGW